MKKLANAICWGALLSTSCFALADTTAESAFCDGLLPVETLVAHLGDKAKEVERKAAGPRKESSEVCSRIYAHPPFDRLSDELIFLVTPFSSAEGATRALERIAKDASKAFGFSRPEAIGDTAVHFRRPDPLSSMRLEMNISFASGKYLVELKYQNVDDGKQNKFVHSSSELEPLAKFVASQLAN